MKLSSWLIRVGKLENRFVGWSASLNFLWPVNSGLKVCLNCPLATCWCSPGNEGTTPIVSFKGIPRLTLSFPAYRTSKKRHTLFKPAETSKGLPRLFRALRQGMNCSLSLLTRFTCPCRSRLETEDLAGKGWTTAQN